MQNIGAYGVEIKDTLHKVKAWDRLTHSWVWFDNAECAFAYRDSVFKRSAGRYLISSVTLRLPKRWQAHGLLGSRRLRLTMGWCEIGAYSTVSDKRFSPDSVNSKRAPPTSFISLSPYLRR